LADEALQQITVSMAAASDRKKEVEALQVKLGTEEAGACTRPLSAQFEPFLTQNTP
jgi:dynein heavy chain 2